MYFLMMLILLSSYIYSGDLDSKIMMIEFVAYPKTPEAKTIENTMNIRSKSVTALISPYPIVTMVVVHQYNAVIYLTSHVASAI